jgi:hypothetical protein
MAATFTVTMRSGCGALHCDRCHLYPGIAGRLAVSIAEAHKHRVWASFRLPIWEDEYDAIAIDGGVYVGFADISVRILQGPEEHEQRDQGERHSRRQAERHE